jgi:Glycosyl hydrolase 36 superfamily, catalytic domain
LRNREHLAYADGRGCAVRISSQERAGWLWLLAVTLTVLSNAGCGGEVPIAGAPAAPDRFDCEGFAVPARPDTSVCGDVNADAPDRLTACLRGSGHLGTWSVDAAGLPAYDFAVDERCDPVAHAFSPRPTPLRDPIHVIGNGRGLVAMAHASGGVEIYTQDRGHKWINHVDTWSDPLNPDYPPQLGGGFTYYTVASPAGARVGSTRFEDLPVNRATQMQSRRFGVGYFETVTHDTDITVRRRVFAPDAAARALVAQVTVENPTNRPQHYEVVEFWDVNVYQITLELLTSDLGFPGVTEAIDHRRRDLAKQFQQRLEWRAQDRLAIATTTAKQMPSNVHDRLDVSRTDYFPDPIYLAVLDDGAPPDAVWLSDTELWDGAERPPPAAAAQPGNAASRAVDLDGEGQHGILALRVPVDVPAHGAVTRRFAFGYVAGGGAPDTAVAELRARGAALLPETEATWAARLVWAAFPGLPHAGAVQRELAWASYSILALTTFDEYRDVLLLGQGGAYKYIHGLDGAMGDLALFAEAVTLIDPRIARDTLTYALATQLGGEQSTPWRFPYATTGVGAFSDVLIYGQRSDAYYFLPAAIGRYVGLTRDHAFLDQPVAFYPRASGAGGDVLEHIRRALDYGTQTLGFGARGIVAIGTGDYADGITELATERATPNGTSSTYNAGAIVYGFPLAADVIEARDPLLAERMRNLAAAQADALNQQAWEGHYFYRGFVDSGNPLAPQVFFLEPQVLPVLAGIVDDGRRDAALNAVVQRLESGIGALSSVTIGSETGVGGPDRPLIGGIWPVANAWLTAAYARRDVNEAWSSFTRNTLAAHAEKYPDLWYGIWTGPDSFNGPDNERPGEADAHQVTALTDYPALNAHMHTSPLRALVDLVGVVGTGDGLRITPRVPTETFAVAWPRLRLHSEPNRFGGSVVASSDGPLVMEVALPSGLRNASVHVTVDDAPVDATVAGGLVRFLLSARAEQPVTFQIK